MVTLRTLDKMLAKHKSRAALRRGLDQMFQKDPLRFFITMVMPLRPKEEKLDVASDGIVEWKSRVEAFPPDQGGESAAATTEGS
jgi:hypothetical protein